MVDAEEVHQSAFRKGVCTKKLFEQEDGSDDEIDYREELKNNIKKFMKRRHEQKHQRSYDQTNDETIVNDSQSQNPEVEEEKNSHFEENPVQICKKQLTFTDEEISELMENNFRTQYGQQYEMMISNLGLLQQKNAINREQTPHLDTNKRTVVLKWLLRVHERCRISDHAWFKSVIMFDKVSDLSMDPTLCAAACSYICSKNFD